jgi:hypothetical protein
MSRLDGGVRPELSSNVWVRCSMPELLSGTGEVRCRRGGLPPGPCWLGPAVVFDATERVSDAFVDWLPSLVKENYCGRDEMPLRPCSSSSAMALGYQLPV